MKNAETTLDNLSILCLNGKLNNGLEYGISLFLFVYLSTLVITYFFLHKLTL